MTLQLLHSEFPLYEENFILLFYQCVRTARELIEMGAYGGEKGMCGWGGGEGGIGEFLLIQSN
jgi:hypothetical protein